MGEIRILPPEVAEKIAAGEVVERPASIAKELIENALDAGATEIVVESEQGGIRKVVVCDNGHGIPFSEADRLFRRHATSKIRNPGDLLAISSYGFRGEALFAIGAVSRIRLLSRPPGSSEGFELRVEGGQRSDPRPAASPAGTRVEVKDIFYNIPARRKFLKSPPVEGDHLRETVLRMALAAPATAFRYVAEGEPCLAFPASDPAGRATAVFGPPIDLLTIEAREGTKELRAYLSPPRLSRTTPAGLYFYVNGRYVRDRILLRAVSEAYRHHLVTGRYPQGVLFLRIDPSRVDVNVHPAKAEVRFRNASEIFDFVRRGIQEALTRAGAIPTLSGADLARHDSRRPPADAQPAGTERIERFFAGSSPAPVPALLPVLQVQVRCFQVHHRYIVQEVEDGILLIDQHALHERELLEKIRRQYASTDLPRQRLLMPAIMAVTEEERSRLERDRRILASLGIEFSDFGRRQIRIDAVPALLSGVSPEELVREYLDAQGRDGEVPAVERALEGMACRAARKFGDSLSQQEIEELLARRNDLENRDCCAHGRPVALRFTLAELERFFQRK